MYTETSERSGLTSVGALEKGSLGVVGGAYSGMVRISNWDIREIVILRYVGILVVESMYNCSAVLWLEELDSFNPKFPHALT